MAVDAAQWELGDIKSQMVRVVEWRVPTAQASSGLRNDINSSLAAIRGWMLTGDDQFKVRRVAVWNDIHAVTAEIDRLSVHWSDPTNIEACSGFKWGLQR